MCYLRDYIIKFRSYRDKYQNTCCLRNYIIKFRSYSDKYQNM